MKEFMNYYDEIIKTKPLAHISKEEDLEWLLGCLDGRIIDYTGTEELWIENGFIYLKIGKLGKALRLKQKRAEKLCNFKCEFHNKLIEYLEDYKRENH